MNIFDSIVIIFAAFLLLFFPESSFVFIGVTFLGSMVALKMLYCIVKNPRYIRFGYIMCFGLLFGYIVSTAVFIVVNLINYGSVDFVENVFFLNYSQSTISDAALIILILSIILSAVSHFEKPINIFEILYNSFAKENIWLIIISAVLIMIGIINGDIGYMGIYQISDRRISPYGALCFTALPPLTVLTISYLLYFNENYKKYRYVLVFVALVLILAVIPLGRRVLIYTLILTAFSIGPKLFKMFKDKKLKMLHLICIAFLFLIISVWGFQIFYATRIALNKLSLERKPPLTEIIPYTIDLMKDSYARAEMQERQRENILHRPFILSYFAGILKVHSGKEISPFLEFRHALAMSIPSLINPDKTRELKPAGEDIIHPLIGIPVFDGPNTIVTAGLNDLGLIGVFIYPIAIVGLYLIIIRSLPAKCPPFVYAFIVLRLIYSILYIEEGLGSLVGSGLRDLFLVAGFYWIISSLPMMRSSIRKAL